MVFFQLPNFLTAGVIDTGFLSAYTV